MNVTVSRAKPANCGLLLLGLLCASASAQPPPEPKPVLQPRVAWQDRPLGQVRSPLVCDVDGDGREELVVGTLAGEIAVLASGRVTRRLRPGVAFVVGLEAADLDGDGAMDFLVVQGSELCAVSLDGTVRWRTKPAEGANPPSLARVRVADLDGNGAMEVVTAGDRVTCWDAQGATRWVAKAEVKATTLELADLDGDGKTEIVVSSPLTVLSCDGRVLWSKPTEARYVPYSVADVNGDGRAEIIVGSRDKIEVFDAKGSSMWSAPTTVSADRVAASPAGGGQPAVIAAGTANYRGGLETWDGSGAPLGKIATGAGVSCLDFLDLDGDGARELVYGTGPMEPFLTVAKPTGETLWRNYVGTRTYLTLAANLRGDGRKELLAFADDLYAFDGSNGDLLWRHPCGCQTHVAATGATGDRTGTVYAGAATLKRYDLAGKLLWESDVPTVNDLVLVRLEEGEEPGVVVGCEDNVLLAMRADGSLLWQEETGWMNVRVAAAQLDDDEAQEVVATDGAMYYAFDSDGRKLWEGRLNLDGRLCLVTNLSVGKLSGGKQDLVFLWYRQGLAVLSQRGALLWHAQTDGEPREVQVRCAKEGSPGELFAVLEDRVNAYGPDGTLLRALDHVAKRRDRPSYVRGTGLLFHDLDGVGGEEAILGLGCLEALSPDGGRVWPNACRCGPTALKMGDLDGTGRREIVAATRGIAVCEAKGDLLCTWPDALAVNSFDVADLDGDGSDEVVVGGSGAVVLTFSRKRGGQ